MDNREDEKMTEDTRRNDRKTIFCDIDGTIFKHRYSSLHDIMTCNPVLLPGVIKKFIEWRSKDYYIVLTTARPEGCRRTTEEHLAIYGLFYDQLVMGLPVGPRVVINDKKPNGMVTSYAISLERNEGLESVEV